MAITQTSPLSSSPWGMSTSSSLMNPSQSYFNNWLRVLNLKTNFYLLSAAFVFVFYSIHEWIKHFFCHWTFFQLFFSICVWIFAIDYKLKKYRDHFLHHFQNSLKPTTNYTYGYMVKLKNACWTKAYLWHWMQTGQLQKGLNMFHEIHL